MRVMTRVGRFVGAWLAAAGWCMAGMIAGAADAAAIDVGRVGSISLNLYAEEAKAHVTDGVLTLYQVASLMPDEDGGWIYAYSPAFADCALPLEDVSSPSLAEKLDEWTGSHELSGTDCSPDANGKIVFSNLAIGLYLIRQTVPSTGFEQINPFLVTLPLSEGEAWIYDIDAGPKIRVQTSEPSGKPETEPQSEQGVEPGTEPQTIEQTEAASETQEQSAESETEMVDTETSGETPDAVKSVKTGDETPVRAMMGLLAAAAVLLALQIGMRYKKREDR